MCPVVADFQWSKISHGILDDNSVKGPDNRNPQHLWIVILYLTLQLIALVKQYIILWRKQKGNLSLWTKRSEAVELGTRQSGCWIILGTVFRLLEEERLLVRTVKYLTGIFILLVGHKGEQLRFFFFCFVYLKGQGRRLTGPEAGKLSCHISLSTVVKRRDSITLLRSLFTHAPSNLPETNDQSALKELYLHFPMSRETLCY